MIGLWNIAQTPPILAMFGGRFIVRAGQSTLVEGNSRGRNAVIEFPTYQAALDCWSRQNTKR